MAQNFIIGLGNPVLLKAFGNTFLPVVRRNTAIDQNVWKSWQNAFVKAVLKYRELAVKLPWGSFKALRSKLAPVHS